MAEKLTSTIFRAVNWLGTVLTLPLLAIAFVAFADPPTMPEDVIRGLAIVLFPVLAITGLINNKMRWLGTIGLVFMLVVWSLTVRPSLSEADNQAYAAVQAGDAQALRSALSRGADPDFYTWNRGYLLSAAVVAGHPETVRILIDAGADVNVRKSNSSTPLLTAVYLGKCEAAVLLLKAGASPEDRFYDYWAYTDRPTYLNKNVHEIYKGKKVEREVLWESERSCWLKFERLLNDPPPSAWTARRVFQEAILPFVR